MRVKKQRQVPEIVIDSNWTDQWQQKLKDRADKVGHLFVTPLSTGLLGQASVLLDASGVKKLAEHPEHIRAIVLPAFVIFLIVALVCYVVLSIYHRRINEQSKQEIYNRRTRQILYSDSAREGQLSQYSAIDFSLRPGSEEAVHLLFGGLKDQSPSRLNSGQVQNLLKGSKVPKARRPAATASAMDSNRFSLSEASLRGISEIKKNFDASFMRPINKKQSMMPFNWWRKPDDTSNYNYNEEDSMSILTETEYGGDLNISDCDLLTDLGSIKSQGSTSCTGLSIESTNLLNSVKSKNFMSKKQKSARSLEMLQEKLHVRSKQLDNVSRHNEKVKSIWV